MNSSSVNTLQGFIMLKATIRSFLYCKKTSTITNKQNETKKKIILYFELKLKAVHPMVQ